LKAYFCIKSICDFVLALFLLLLTIPLFIFLFVLLRIHLGEFPLFFQKRIGLENEVFTVIKFKSLNKFQSANEDYSNLSVLVRKLGLDELPQLINILKGEMSFVGPRPLLVEYQDLFNDFQNIRHQVKPGITGLVQVSGGNSLSWAERFELDVSYVRGFGFLQDVLILLRTPIAILMSKSKSEHQSQRFTGNK